MKWKSKISRSESGKVSIHGADLADLQNRPFAEVVFLLLKGKRATEREARVFNAILVSMIDHGLGPLSTTAARVVASGGNEVHTSVAAGILAMGKHHGAAIRNCMEVLAEPSIESFVQKSVEKKERIAGFGHKLYDADPRAERLMKLAMQENLRGEHMRRARKIESQLEELKGKKLCLNVDGAVAAILCDLGFTPMMGEAVFVIARTPGLCAHVCEELTREQPASKRLDASEYTFS